MNLINGATGNGSTVSGATNATLTVNSAQLADAADAGTGYDCVVTVACGSSTTNSDRVALVVNSVPAVFAVTGGGSGCSSPGVPVGLSSSEIGVDYWLRTNGVFNGIVVAGTGSALGFGNQTLSRTYTIQASNALGGCTALMSGSAVVTIIAPPVITSGPTPASATNYESLTTSFTVTATGGGLSYQWQRDGTNLLNGGNILGASSSSLQVSSLAAADTTALGHGYRCVVSGTCGPPVLSGEALLTVQPNLWVGMGAGLNKLVAAVALSGNDLFVGGQFTNVAGITVNHIAKWNGSTWSALGTGIGSGGGLIVREVRALAVSGNDVYAAGYFGSAGGVLASHIAKWDGTSWSALGSGLNEQVVALAVSGNDVYAGGYFTNAGGFPANYVAKWNGSSWSALGTGLNSDVRSLAVVGNDVYVGGTFTTAGGVAANRIAKWNGSSWSALGSGMSGNLSPTVYGIVGSGSDLYAAGRFTTAGGVGANSIAKWNGTTWSALGSGLGGASGAPGYTLLLADSNLYVGGEFTTAGGGSANNIAEWNGTTWSKLGAGCNGGVISLAASSNVLFAGGGFTTAGGKVSPYLAKYILSGNTVNTPPQVPNAIPDMNGVYGTPFNFTFAANTFNDPDAGQTLTYSASGLPTGITFTPATRTFSGTPTNIGTASVTVTATDNGTPALNTNDVFDLVIAKAPLTITATDTNRVYGSPNPQFTGILVGVVNTDNITATFTTAATIASPPGTYPITPILSDPDGKLNSYVTTTNNGMLTITSPPELSFTAGGGGLLTLSWPANASNFLLEFTESLTPPISWLEVTSGITENSGIKSYTVPDDPGVPGRLYRLRLQ